jgi:hypothetical protein
MYVEAPVHQSAVAGSAVFFDKVMANKDVPMWAHCADSSWFMIKALSKFGIGARMLTLWHTWGDTHGVLEYWSPRFQKYVYYDPLYGVLLIAADGTPASVEDMEGEVARHGLHSATWIYQPVRFYDYSSTEPVVASDPIYEFFNSWPYQLILNTYLSVIAVRYIDYAFEGGFMPNGQGARGKWSVNDNTAFANLTPALSQALRNNIIGQFSIGRGGAYYLAWHQVQPEEAILIQ